MPKGNHLISLKAGAAFALAFYFFGQIVHAVEPKDIQEALSGRTAFEANKPYRPWRQYFAADGSTVYLGDGPSSAGKWEVRGKQFCSLWPPAKDWVCYNVELSAAGRSFSSIVWINKDGTRESADLFDGDQTELRAAPKR